MDKKKSFIENVGEFRGVLFTLQAKKRISLELRRILGFSLYSASEKEIFIVTVGERLFFSTSQKKSIFLHNEKYAGKMMQNKFINDE